MKSTIGVTLLLMDGAVVWAATNAQGYWQILLLISAGLLALLPTAMFFGRHITGDVAALITSGVLLVGAISFVESDTEGVKVVAAILAYVLWLIFSNVLFGTPLILIPFPPFIIFMWRQLTTDQKEAMWQRLFALGILFILVVVVLQLRKNV